VRGDSVSMKRGLVSHKKQNKDQEIPDVRRARRRLIDAGIMTRMDAINVYRDIFQLSRRELADSWLVKSTEEADTRTLERKSP